MRAVLALLLMSAALACGAIEARDARQLEVTIERLAEPVIVDGVRLQVHSAVGPDVARLAERIRLRWRQEGSLLSQHRHDGWHLLARLGSGHHEVIQWRGEGRSAQLLHSVLDATRAPARPPAAPFRLPRSCAWMRVIEGRAGRDAYQQRSARCRAGPASVLDAIRRELQALGWTVREGAGQSLQVFAKHIDGQVTVTAGEARGESGVVWVGRQAAGPGP